MVLAEEDDTEDLKNTTEGSVVDVEGTTHPKIWGQQLRVRCRDDGPEYLLTTTEASAEKEKSEASAEGEEATRRPRERLRRRRRHLCDYCPG